MRKKCMEDTKEACYISDMCIRLRQFLLYLLIVSLPVHAIAGVARFECGMSHHVPAVGAAARAGMPMEGIMGDSAHAGGHEHAGAESTTSDDEDCGSIESDARSSCGTCGACCIGAFAPPPVFFLAAVDEPVNGVQQFSSSPFVGHIPSRIERPPRAAVARVSR